MQLVKQRRHNYVDKTLPERHVLEIRIGVGKTLHAVCDGATEGNRQVPLLLADLVSLANIMASI